MTLLPVAESQLLLLGLVGSHAYGLANENSDEDRLGVYWADTVQFHGLNPPVGCKDTIVQHEPNDVTVHEALKFARLCLNGNPTVTELLWLNEYEVISPLGENLIAIAEAFLSAQRVRDSYFGYAIQQFKRLEETGQFQSKMRARAAKHGRHLLRLLHQGFELYSTGRLTIKVADPQWYIDNGNKIAEDKNHAKQFLDAAQEKFNSVTSALPEKPNEEVVESWLLKVRAAHYKDLLKPLVVAND